jgi:16S rRNA (guanine527-N7)-methyltransferase
VKQHLIKYHGVPRETFRRIDELIDTNKKELDLYLDQLAWWNKRINLVSRDVPRETIVEHIRHSILLTHLNTYVESDLIVDSGTGGGLPGIPLAIVSREKRFLLNDIVSKKSLAVKQITKKIELDNVSIRGGSISDLNIAEPFLLISKHAFKIPELIELARNLPWSSMIFYKGIDYKEELAQIDLPLNICIYDLFKDSRGEFYEGKFLVEVSKQQ